MVAHKHHKGGALLTKSGGSLDVSTLEGWLWDAACQVRGPLDVPKFKDYILPLIFLSLLTLSTLSRR
jgi:type I restriction-modification system DNA methylase subunit